MKCFIDFWETRYVYLWLPLLLLFVYWWLIKNGKDKNTFWIGFFLKSIPLAIGGIQIVVPNIPKFDFNQTIIFGSYYFAITMILFLMEEYKNLLPQTKKSYTFNKRYTGIQEQWNLVKKEDEVDGPKGVFVDESLRSLEDTLTLYDFYNNNLSEKERKIRKFATEAGSLSKDYIILCSNNNEFFSVIFASLYRYLFTEYKTKVLSSIRPTSIGGADLIIPEFVSNEMTQVIIKNSKKIDYQHNTSVTSIRDFKDNVTVGTELNGNYNNNDSFLQRLIITDNIDAPQKIDLRIFRRIIDWHKMSNMDLRFISLKDAENEKRKFPRVDRLDFSIIKMKAENKWFVLGADRLKSGTLAGNKHEMYSVRCIPQDEEPEENRLFNELWGKAKEGKIINGNSILFDICS